MSATLTALCSPPGRKSSENVTHIKHGAEKLNISKSSQNITGFLLTKLSTSGASTDLGLPEDKENAWTGSVNEEIMVRKRKPLAEAEKSRPLRRSVRKKKQKSERNNEAWN